MLVKVIKCSLALNIAKAANPNILTSITHTKTQRFTMIEIVMC